MRKNGDAAHGIVSVVVRKGDEKDLPTCFFTSFFIIFAKKKVLPV